MTLKREEILAAQDLKSETVEVPEWGGPITLRELTALERERFQDLVVAKDGAAPMPTSRMFAWLVALCTRGEDGERLFSDGDVEAIANKSLGVLLRLGAIAQRLNSLGAEAAEDAVKNSGPSRSD